jgi:hypothetical protein
LCKKAPFVHGDPTEEFSKIIENYLKKEDEVTIGNLVASSVVQLYGSNLTVKGDRNLVTDSGTATFMAAQPLRCSYNNLSVHTEFVPIVLSLASASG